MKIIVFDFLTNETISEIDSKDDVAWCIFPIHLEQRVMHQSKIFIVKKILVFIDYITIHLNEVLPS